LTVLLKSLAQVAAPIVSAYLYNWYGFEVACLSFAGIAIAYGVLLVFAL